MGRITKKELYEEQMMFFSLKFSHPEIVSNISSFREMSKEQWVELLSQDFSFIKYIRRNEVKRRDLIDILRTNIKCVDDISTYYPSLTFTIQEFIKILTYLDNNDLVIRDKESILKLISMSKLNFSSYHLSSLIMNHHSNISYIMEYFGDEIDKYKNKFMYVTKIILCANDLYKFDDLTNEELTSKFRLSRSFRNIGLEQSYNTLLNKSATDEKMKKSFMFCFLCKYDGTFAKYTASRYQTYLFTHQMGNSGSETLVETLDTNFTDIDIGIYIDPNKLTDFGIDYYCYRGLVKYVDFTKLNNINVKRKFIYQIASRLELDDELINNVQWHTIKSKPMIEALFYYMYDMGMNALMLDVYSRLNDKYISRDIIRKYNLYRM